jgi:hypothetical protein
MTGIVLLALILLLCACNLAAQSPATPTLEEPTEPAIETYTNDPFGYTVEYPAGLTLDSSEDGASVWIDRQISITILNFNPEEPRGDGPVIESAEDMTVGPYPARHLTGYIGSIGGNTPQRYEAAAIPHNGLSYIVSAFELKNDVQLPPDRELGAIPPDALALFDQVLAGFRFTD